MALMCKLYDMSNLPMLKSHKIYIYTALVMTISSASFYMSSVPLADMLVKLDEKYEKVYQQKIK